MSATLRKRQFIPLAEQRVGGKSGQRIYPAAKAFTLPQRDHLVLAAGVPPQHGVKQPMPEMRRA